MIFKTRILEFYRSQAFNYFYSWWMHLGFFSYFAGPLLISLFYPEEVTLVKKHLLLLLLCTSRLRALRFSIRFAFPALLEMSRKTKRKKNSSWVINNAFDVLVCSLTEYFYSLFLFWRARRAHIKLCPNYFFFSKKWLLRENWFGIQIEKVHHFQKDWYL